MKTIFDRQEFTSKWSGVKMEQKADLLDGLFAFSRAHCLYNFMTKSGDIMIEILA